VPPEREMPDTVPRRGGADLDTVTGQALGWLVTQSHLMRPDDVAALLAEAARPLGVSGTEVYLADLQQRHLVPLASGGRQAARALPIDATLAGRAYRTVTIQHTHIQHTQAPPEGEAHQIWIPLVDGTERLGVLAFTASDVGEAMLARYQALASLAGLMITAKSGYSDTYAQTQRSREMALQAELVWAALPPRTFATDRVLVSATLEPAYGAGGDAFDYSLLGDRLHVSIFDALGHDLSAGLLASVSMASCRSTRRSGGSLTRIVARADEAIARQFGDLRFVTALLADLDLGTGLLSWITRGHPAPLLIRGNRTVRELTRPSQLPLGLAAVYSHNDHDIAMVHTERLEPGDRVLLYTDGVTEGHSAHGTSFGLQRLSNFIIRHSSEGIPAPETMRRLNHAILDYQQGRLRDDATVVMVEWMPSHPRRDLTAEPA
jgi:stage II sporulation SpoE-like protein